MNKEQFEQLLYEEEGTTLDFKKDQYLFSKATELEKSELLKDILGFANAWRRATAFILIGVEDVQGGRGKIIGISPNDHLQDHSLQQFVNNLTNCPVKFHYEAFSAEGKHIGIISIEEQVRPIYLKRDYGKLKKNEVYVRRGSSTDPTKPALPEEIIEMGTGSSQEDASLFIQFCHVETEEPLGPSLAWESEYCKMPPQCSIPDLSSPKRDILQASIFDRTNHGFYRELANYECVRRLCQPVRLAVKNTGKVAARNVRVEMVASNPAETTALKESDLPSRPSEDILTLPAFSRGIQSNHQNPGDIAIESTSERLIIKADFGDLQPERRICSETFYIGSKISQEILLSILVYADNLTVPKESTLNISVSSKTTSMTVEQLKLMR